MQYTTENMLIHPKPNVMSGVYAEVTAEQAGWDFMNMTARRLTTGQAWSGNTGNREYSHVILGGVCAVRTSRGNYERVGKRENVFAGKPHAVYIPRHTDFEFEALTDNFDLASCWVPTDEDHPLQRVTPPESVIELRGKGNASRHINSIMPPGYNCHRLVAVEVYTPGGNWSSFPPHKHDEHKEDANGNLIEADLEEIYFYKIDKPEGFAYQRVYTADGRIDAVMLARDNDIILVPEGYHPVVSAHGYTSYYLNYLAGSAQSLMATDDPQYAWIKGTWAEMPLDPRLPLME